MCVGSGACTPAGHSDEKPSSPREQYFHFSDTEDLTIIKEVF